MVSLNAGNVVYGIWFDDAAVAVSNVIVEHIWQQPGAKPFQPDRPGHPGERRDGGAHRRHHQHGGQGLPEERVEPRSLGALMTMNLSGSIAGPPHPLPGFIAQNAVSYVGAAGTIVGNEIIGSGGNYGPPAGNANGTAILMSGANNVTIDSNTITGFNTDVGVSVRSNQQQHHDQFQ